MEDRTYRSRRPRASIAALGAAVALLGAESAPAETFTNPLIRQNSADPFMVRHGEQWYLTYTSPPAGPSDRWRLVVRRAPTLAGLTEAEAHVIWDPAATGEPPQRGQLLWAPELFRLQGPDGAWRWYVYYAAGSTAPAQRSHVLESAGDDPLGPYRYKATLKTPDYAIDGTVWRRPGDGRLFFFWAGVDPGHVSSSVFVSEMSDPWTLTGPPVLVAHPSHLWEMVGLPINEAPEVLTRGDRLHIVFSASYCAFDAYALGRVSVPIGADPLDPHTWENAKHPRPIFASSPENGVWAPGHAGFFASPDGSEHWMVYGATSAPGAPANGQGCGGVRTVRAQRFAWNADGTPQLGSPVRAGTPLLEPSARPRAARCPGRRIRVRMPARYRARFRSAVVLVNGRRRARLRRPRTSAVVWLSGRRELHRVTLVIARGRDQPIRHTRRYWSCSQR